MSALQNKSDWQIIVDGLQDINPQTPIAVAMVVARTAAVMGHAAIRITADLETHLRDANERIEKLESEVYLMHHVTPIKRLRKRGKR